MKHFFTLLVTFIPFLSSAQLQDLAKLSEGEMVYSQYIYDNDVKLFGYFLIYELDQLDKATTEYEYILLDKNLNPALNTRFTSKTHSKVRRKFVDAEYMGDNISLTSRFMVGKYGTTERTIFSSIQLISLTKKAIKDEFYFEDNRLVSMPESFEAIYEKHRKLANVSHGRVYGVSYEDFTGYLAEDAYVGISMFDQNKEQLWRYDYNKLEMRNKVMKHGVGKRFVLRLVKDNYALGLEVNSDVRKAHYFKKIKAFGLDTPEKNFEYTLQDGDSEYNLLLWKTQKIGDEFHLFGEYSKNTNRRTTSLDNRLGFYRCVLNTKAEELGEKFFKWETLGEELKIDRYGRLKNGYYLKLKDIYVFKNGTSAILFEKYKPKQNALTTDMVLVQFDKDFNYLQSHTIEKAKSQGYYHSDYLYSQYIKERNGVVFFFKDKVPRKNEWILGINTIIDGRYNYEQLTLNSDEYELDVMPAKEGYILIHEADKSSKKEKNELRLERLNF